MGSADSARTIVAGVIILSTSPLFRSLVAVHVMFALSAVIAGAIAMFARKVPSSFGIALTEMHDRQLRRRETRVANVLGQQRRSKADEIRADASDAHSR